MPSGRASEAASGGGPAAAQEEDPPQPPGPDVRLLVPALIAWAAVAGLLGAPMPVLLAVGVAAGGLAGALVVPGARRRRRAVRPRPAGCPPWGTRRSAVALSGTVVALAVCCLAGHRMLRETGPIGELAADRATVTLQGLIEQEPRRLPPRTGRPLEGTSVVLRLRAEQVTARGETSSVRTPVLVVADERWSQLTWRSDIQVVGRLSASERAEDVVAVLFPRGGPEVLASPGALEHAADVVRARFREAVSVLPEDAAGLLPGLVVGDTSRSPPELTAAMQATGLTHLSAVSGSNVAIVLAVALAGCRAVGLPRRWRPAAGAAALVGFVVLVRPEPSVLRAAVMGAVGLLALSSSRRHAGLPALATSIVVLLAADPWLARSFGFALSVLATLGLLLFVRPWGAALARRLPRRMAGAGPILALPLAAQVMCAPVVVLLQGSVSLVGVPANLLAAPLVAPATVVGVGCAVVSVVSVPLGSVVAWVAALPVLGIAAVARLLSSVPLGSVPWPQGWPGSLALAGLLLVGLLAGRACARVARTRALVVVGALLLVAAVSVPTRDMEWPLPGWQLVACDIGQGDALVLRTAPGRAVLVDAGPDPDLVDGCLARLGVADLDAVVLTHYHADHVAGLPGAGRGRSVAEIIVTPVREPPYQAEQVRTWAAEHEVPVVEARAGDVLTWPGLRGRVWWPARTLHEGSVPNNGSLVLSVSIAGLRAVLLGDVESEAAVQLVAAWREHPGEAPEGIDVLKVAHHGSANRDDRIVDLTAPTLALISVGAENDYGHPASSTLSALRERHVAVLRTDQAGDIAAARGPDGVLQVATRGP